MTEQLQDRHSVRIEVPKAERVKAMIAIGVTVLLWASAFVVIRDAGQVLAPGPLALVRIGVAAAALTVVGLVRIARTRAVVRVPRRSLLLIALYGVLWLAGYTVLLNAGERHVDAGTAALLVNIAPLLVAFGAGLFLGEGYPRALIVGSLVAFGGVGIIALDSGGHRDWTGALLCLAAALLYAAGVLIQKAALRGVDGFTATWFACVAGFVVLLPWLPEAVGQLASAPSAAILGAVYLGLFPTAIGFSTWAYALRRTEAGRLTATTYAVPAVSVLLSSVLLSEVPSVLGLLGGVVCLAGVAISRRRPR